MGLTKPRAYQIFDIDYKQAVKVITLTNINLTGGAPATVDGVGLSVDDRVLVAGNSSASENGIYVVVTVGTGTNGTWTRSVDANETGEIQAGMVVMVTEGSLYNDTQWKLITNDPITVGTTSLVFEQIGTSLAGNFLPTANATYTLGNSTYRWASLYVSGNTIYIGDSTISSDSTGISLTSPGGAVFTVSGNISGSNVYATTFSGTSVSVSGSINGGNLFTGGEISATGRIQGANIVGSNLLTSGIVSAAGNITGANIRGVNIDSINADVAERYLADADYPVGTVLVIGGTQEVTQSTGYAQTTVVGTVSEQPALTMNRDLQGEHVVSLAFLGRVPCRVVGNIDRGDMLVSSNTTGVATSMDSYIPGAVLGKALESYNSDTPGVIEIIVGRL